MKSKYSNQDLINATFEIYNEFKQNQTEGKAKKSKEDIIQKPEPLLLSKEVKIKKKQSKKVNIEKKKKIKHYLDYKSPINQKISNERRLAAYQKKKGERKYKSKLRLNKIIKFENEKYLLLNKIKNSDLKIIKMKRPSL
tara:strand:+ start:82 stop:498 length:417 start_codon:yes stop_codon:yes gene_type:complete